MKIVISEWMDERAVAQLAARHDVLYLPDLVDDPPRLGQEALTADVLIVRNRTQVRGDLLERLQRCRIVGHLGVGLDNIDVPACEARGIKVIPATGANARSVAEYVIATAMLLLRGAYQSTAAVAAGQWPRGVLGTGREVGGKTLGLVGFGDIGRMTAGLARGVGMKVIAFDAMMDRDHRAFLRGEVRPAGLAELVAGADVISLHVPLVDATRGLFNAERIAAMKKGAVLINSSNGGIVDEAALVAALRNGHLGGAALDVFGTEPLPPGTAFAGCPNLVLTPHIAGVSAESNERACFMIAEKVLAALG